jgi:hypothetical protein
VRAKADFNDFTHLNEAARIGNMKGESGEIWTVLIPVFWHCSSRMILSPTCSQAIEYREYEESAIEADPRKGIAKFSAAVFEAAAGSILVHIVLAARLQ